MKRSDWFCLFVLTADVLATSRNHESAADSAYGKLLLFLLSFNLFKQQRIMGR